MGEGTASRSMRWRLVRSLLVFAGVGGAYAGLASLEEMTPPPDAVQLDDLAAVNNSKNGKQETTTTTVATTTTTKATTTTAAATSTGKDEKGGSTKPTYTYVLTQPINSQLNISP